MKRHVRQCVFSVIILAILLVPVSTSVNNWSDSSTTETDSAIDTQDAIDLASNWLTGWKYRKEHQILGTPGAGVNYQIEMQMNYGSGADLDNNMFCDSSCQSDFDDIRFTSSDGITLLDYWRETYYASDNATFWVEVNDNLDYDTSIFVYYGNSGCSTTSNGTETFVFFDDFDDGIIDAGKWETYGPWTESGGVAAFTIVGTGGTSVLPDLMTDSSWDMRNKSLVSSWRVNQLTVNREWGVSCANTVGDDHTRLAYFLAFNTSDNNNLRSYYDTSAGPVYDHYEPVIGQYPPNTFMKTEFVSTPNNETKNTWIQNGEILDTYNGNWFDATPQHIFLGFYVHGYTNTLESGYLEMEFDYVYLRNQVNVELNHGSWSGHTSWLEGWDCRKNHEITGSPGSGENYQIEIVVHYGYGTDGGKKVYCDGQCQPDFADIRFTDNDGITLLDYWQELYSESGEATFWVEVKDNLDSDVSIYMYYGNPNCTTTSNGTATFIFFDDFESTPIGSDPDPSKWWLEATQDADDYVRIALDPADVSNHVAEAAETGDSVANVAWANDWGSVGNIAIGHKFRYDLDFKGYYATKDDSQTFIFIDQLEYLGENNHQWYDVDSDNYFDYSPSLATVTDEWYSWEYRFFDDEMTLVNRDNDVVSTGGYVFSTINETRTTCTRYGLRHGANTWWTDDMYVRKFVSSEPTHGAWDGVSTVHWYHDCSSTTGFVYSDSWNMNWMQWTMTTGTLSSDGSALSVTYIPVVSDYHGPVFEYELPSILKLRDINNFSALLDADNSVSSYTGYQVVMLGDADRNPVLFFSFGDGWAASCLGAYGISYVFENGSRVGFGSGYPVTWTSFNGIMNISSSEDSLLGYVEGVGQEVISGLTEADFDRVIKYVAIASARFGSDPMFPVLVDELYLNYAIPSESLQPAINDVEDFWYEVSESDNVIEWNIENFNPISYELWRDGGLLTSDAWPGGSQIEVDVNNLSPGEYNYTIIVFGDSGTVVSDTVIVTVLDLTHPTLGILGSGSYEYGTTGHTIGWPVSDLYPGEYTITRNDSPIETGSWTSGIISIDIDGLDLGVYDFRIMVNDSSGNVAQSTVTIMVIDTTAPILNHPTDIIGDITLASIQITWQPTDFLPFNYEIYENGTLVSNGTWTSGENLTYTIDELTTTSYNITIIVWDTSGNYARDTVLVNIEQESVQPVGDIVVISITVGSLAVIVVVIGLICRNKDGPQSGTLESGYNW